MPILETLLTAKVFDLSQPYFPGMPHFPTHPPYLFGLTKKHGDYKNGAMSSAADAIAFSGHTGTHIDALNHFSCNGLLFGGKPVDPAQSIQNGISLFSADTISPIIRRGVLLDIAGLAAVDPLPGAFTVLPEHLERAADKAAVNIQSGDVVLVRTGWGAFFENPARYNNNGIYPGPELAAAQWLSEKKIFAAGSDTMPFERVPAPEMPVHVHLLVKSGIHIIENLYLEELAREKIYEFAFTGAPLRIRGGTGAPVRPLALA